MCAEEENECCCGKHSAAVEPATLYRFEPMTSGKSLELLQTVPSRFWSDRFAWSYNEAQDFGRNTAVHCTLVRDIWVIRLGEVAFLLRICIPNSICSNITWYSKSWLCWHSWWYGHVLFTESMQTGCNLEERIMSEDCAAYFISCDKMYFDELCWRWRHQLNHFWRSLTCVLSRGALRSEHGTFVDALAATSIDSYTYRCQVTISWQ